MDLSIRKVVKRFGHVTALRDVSLDVAAGEFCCFLGPSGCGKTTLLRAIAGLEEADDGEVRLGGHDLAPIPARRRNFGVVFQSYSLFPNMTAARNVGYGLECRRRPRAEIAARVEAMLRLVHLSDQAAKLPSQLSGGQQQRVALARALAPDPALLLLDEPLSALDAKVREELRGEIRDLQRRLGITTIMVTHDQDEALAMADRIVVMNAGRIEQVGTPAEIYRAPQTAFVANFIGRMNLLPVAPAGGGARFADTILDCGAGAAGATMLGIRPESVELAPEGTAGPNLVPGTVVASVYLGNFSRVEFEIPGSPARIVAELHGAAAVPPAGARLALRLPADALRPLS